MKDHYCRGQFSVSNCVLNFERHHPLLKLALESVNKTYNPNSWTGIGPELMTRIARTVANTTQLRCV